MAGRSRIVKDNSDQYSILYQKTHTSNTYYITIKTEIRKGMSQESELKGNVKLRFIKPGFPVLKASVGGLKPGLAA
jgi:uncharacterized protein YeaC (DUF1315 family)